jgi:hypothetical protein
MKRFSLVVCCAALAACSETPPTAVDAPPAQAPLATRTIRDDVVGVSLDVPAEWQVQSDPVLFNTYGFALFDPQGPRLGGHARSPVARIALARPRRGRSRSWWAS